MITLIKELRRTKSWIQKQYTPHDSDTPVLRAIGLDVHYESGYALKDVTFELRAGERLAVVGPNGAGKSTLFKVFAGVLRPSNGVVQVFGREPDGHICIAYVPQRSLVDWSFPVSVADVVMMGRVGKLGLFRWPTANDWHVVRESLEVVKMDHLGGRQISELSGGQQQRMFIARALAQDAELMLMDEPLTGLDVNSQEQIFYILDVLRTRGITVMVALHDLKLASERFDRVMLLNRRMMGLGSPEEVFHPDKLIEAYGEHIRLVSTVDGMVVVEDTCCDEGVHVHD